MLRERQEVAKQLIGGCSYSAGGKFYESLNAFVRVAKRTFRWFDNAWRCGVPERSVGASANSYWLYGICHQHLSSTFLKPVTNRLQ